MIQILDKENFGQNILFTRLLQNVSSDDLAKAAGISKDQLDRIESGLQQEICEDTLIALANGLGVSLQELLDE